MILIQTNAATVAKKLGLNTKRVKKSLERSIKEIAESEKRAIKYQANKIKFRGELARAIYAKAYKKRAEVRIFPMFVEQAKALEYGPQAVGYPPTGRRFYLNSPKNYLLKEWAEVKGKADKGYLVVGGENTRWGRPSHRFISNARVGRLNRIRNIIIKNLTQGGK